MESLSGNVYEFPPFRFDASSGELSQDGRLVRLPAQAANVLGILLQRAGEVVTREQLRAQLWPEGDSLSYDEAINKSVSYLRYVLRDSSRTPKYIQTLPKRGYRFLAAVTRTEIAPAPPETGIAEPDPTAAAASAPPPDSLPETPVPVRRRRAAGWSLLAMLLLLAACAAGWWYVSSRGNAAPARVLRIGIAPFESDGTEAAGLAESFRLDLTDALSQSPYLRVNAAHMAHASSMGPQEMLALHADVLIFGRLLQKDGHVQLQLELARGDDASHLATFKYDIDQKDLIVMRRQAEQDLLAALRPSGSGAGPVVGSTNDAQAYAIYLQARAHLQQWNPEGWAQATDEFRRAIARDPSFARAYSGLATVLISMAEHGNISQSEGYEEARQTAQKALAIDPQLAEGHAALGNIAYRYDWNFHLAEQEFRRAIEIDPAQSHYRVWLADLLCVQGQFLESIQQVGLAHSLDPSWKAPYMAAIFIFGSAGQHERSLEAGKQLLALEPDSAMTYNQLGWSYWYAGHFTEAAESWRKMAQLEKDRDREQFEVEGLKALRQGGPKAYAELRLRAIESGKKWQHAGTDFVPSEWFVFAGQTDNAIAAFSSQFARRDPAVLQIAVNPAYLPLHNDARFQMLVHRLGFTIPSPLDRNAWRSVWE